MAIKNGKTSSNAETTTQTQNTAELNQYETEGDKAIAKFDEPEFNEPISRIPIAQIINTQIAEQAGIFITKENLQLAGWKGKAPTNTHIFGGDKPKLGLYFKQLRINVIQESLSYLERREDDKVTGAKVGTLVDVYESESGRELYNAGKDDSVYVLRKFYYIFILDENNQKLHEVPIAISIKGVAFVKFSEALQSFRSDLETAFAAKRNIKKVKKNAAFHRQGVFALTFAPSHEPKEQTDSRKRSWVAIVENYEVPSPDGSDFFKYFCYENEEDYNILIATNPDLTMGINKAAPIARLHNHLVLSGKVNMDAKLLPAASTDEELDS